MLPFIASYPLVLSPATGLPIGVQIAAAPWQEDLALAAAAIIEGALGGWCVPLTDSGAPQ